MNMKRMRGRNNRGGGQGGGGGGPIRHQSGNVPLNRNHVFDSIGPDLRIRGTSQQLFEKYLQLGRDATSSGDRVMAESYFQHAEHYFRILNAMNQAAQQQAQHQPRPREFQQDSSEGEQRPEYRPEFRNEPQTSEPRQQVSADEPEEDEEPAPLVTTPREITIAAAPPD